MRLNVVILFLFIASIGRAQEYGSQWVLGPPESVLDFRDDTLKNYSIGPIMPMFLTAANICDSSGNLLYYTNGIYIAGADGYQIENGDSLSPCSYTNQWASDGLDIPQAALFLPMPGSTRYYYLFHFSNDTFGSQRPGILYYSIIDKLGNTGNGVVIKKNVIYYDGTIFRDGGMTACKHANGRDYWIVIGDIKNTYYSFLLTPTGIADTLKQTIGPSYDNSFNIAYSKFSQDGSKYVTGCANGPILIMNFDRCTGNFSSPVALYNQACTDSTSCSGASGIEFSPNGRFLYVDAAITLNQYDLLDSNTQHDSVMLYQSDSNDAAEMNFLQLAPNGKIYGSCHNGGFYFIHAVNYPDLKGDSADYVDTAFTTLTINTNSLPNMINYQLGALSGSPCDTIWPTGVAKVDVNGLLRVMPNPADKYLYVEMGMQGNYEFDLLNMMGQIIDKKETKQVDNFDTEALISGLYFLKATDRSTEKVFTQKIMVQH